MDFEYIDHKELGVSIKKINKVIKETDWDEFERWYVEQALPRGLQCIELHMHPSMKDYVIHLMKERNLDGKDKILRLKIALAIDAMIH